MSATEPVVRIISIPIIKPATKPTEIPERELEPARKMEWTT